MKLKAFNTLVFGFVILAIVQCTSRAASPGTTGDANPEKISDYSISSSSNAAPVMKPIADQLTEEGQLLQLNVEATDPDPRQTIRYSLGPNVPSGATINVTNGIFRWIPSSTQAPSTNQVTLIATDNGSGFRSASQTFTIVVRQANPVTVTSTSGSAPVSLAETSNQAGAKYISGIQLRGTALSGQTMANLWILESSTNAVDWAEVEDGMFTTDTNIIYRVRSVTP